jgi:CheY-like chemotaxis protein
MAELLRLSALEESAMPPAKTVLIVDDSRVSRLLLRQFILSRRCFWHIEESPSGEDAIARMQRVLPHPTLPDLILLDVNMPGMGGMAAAAQLRMLCPDAHISLMTANIQMNTRRRATELGLGFLAKPMTEQRIGALLDALGH